MHYYPANTIDGITYKYKNVLFILRENDKDCPLLLWVLYTFTISIHRYNITLLFN